MSYELVANIDRQIPNPVLSTQYERGDVASSMIPCDVNTPYGGHWGVW